MPADRDTEAPAISVVAPVHRNSATLEALSRRVAAALADERFELILVDDCSPDGSGALIDSIAAADQRVVAIHLDRNRGQHAAALAGIRAARGERVVVLDADLQDPPEAIPALLERSRCGYGAVFASRRGRYEGAGRLLSSRLFKATMSAALRLPPGSGMFVVLDREAVRRLLALAEQGPPPFVVAMIGCSGVRMDAVPVARARRDEGASSYSSLGRVRSALRGLRWAGWARLHRAASNPPASAPVEEVLQSHNERQRRYYSGEKPNMEPRPSRYLERHVDELVAFAGLAAGDRVLEVGCGLGRYTLPLSRRGLRVEGIDISADLLQRLERSLPPEAGVTLHHADVLAPPPELARDFDAVIGGFVLHHLHDVPRSIDAMVALLRPGGTIAFLEPNPYNPLYYAQMAISPTMTFEGDRGMLEMRRRPLLAAMRRAGVAEPRFERFGFFPPFIADRPRAAPVERRLERVPPLQALLPFQLVGGRAEDGRPSSYG